MGFGAEGRREHFVVIQGDFLSSLETVIVVPLDDHASFYDENPLAIAIPKSETSTLRAQVALVHLPSYFSLEKFDAAPTGRLSSRTMAKVDDALRIVLDL